MSLWLCALFFFLYAELITEVQILSTLCDITLKFQTVLTIAFVDFRIMKNIYVQLLTVFLFPTLIGSLVTAKNNWCVAVKLLIYTIQIFHVQKSHFHRKLNIIHHVGTR